MEQTTDAYEKLLKEYRELQLRVTRFSAVEQQLINIRDRLDNELDMYKRIQQFSSRALTIQSKLDFIRHIADGVVDIFETEGSIVLYERGGSDPVSLLYSEGVSFNGISEENLKTCVRNVSNDIGKTRSLLVSSEVFQKHPAFKGFREGLWFSFHDETIGFDIHIGGLISFEKSGFYSPLLDRHSTIFGVYSQQAISLLSNFQRGLTIRRQLEKINASSKELLKLSLIATKTKSGVIITDNKGHIEWVNESFSKTTGYTLEEVKGKKPKDFLQRTTDPEYDDVRKTLSESLSKRERVEVTIINYNKWGEPYYNQLEITPVFDEQGQHINFIALQKDITTEKKFQEEIIHKNIELKKINAELDNFVYSISHDLRAPLLSIKGILRLITMKEKLGETATNYIKMADSSVDRLDLTVQEILDYSRNARLDLQITEFDLSMVIEDIFNDLRYGSEREISFALHFEGSKIIKSDRYRMSTLLKNIIGNSVKYRNRKINNSMVEVTVIHKNETLEISVADNGIGIAAHNTEKIFEMFYRASSDVTGTGLGLYICKEIISRLGGQIRVESELGIGTTMHITLPEVKN
ncbi:MAG: ATP-binding protein [Bacteroidota bacterium]|jgi:PAS domain S-box-containing protein